MEDTNHEDQLGLAVQGDNDYFKRMLDFIPVNFYFTKTQGDLLTGKGDDEEEESSEDEEDVPDKKPVVNVKKHKDIDPEEKLQKKKARFDPNLPHTVTQVQDHIFSKPQQTASNAGQKVPKKKKKVKDDDDADSIRSSTDTIEELRERLQARIDELKVKRKALGKGEALEKKKMKRRQSKMELKLRKKMDKQSKNKGAERAPPVNGLKKSVINSPSKPIYNKEGKMVFSKFDFTESGKEKKKLDVPTGKNYKKLLEHVTKEKEKIKQLKQTDEQKAKELENKNAWKNALAKAEGIKIKDNPELLKKSMKRKEKIKKHSEKKWNERTSTVEKKLQDKQDKRKKNLQNQKKANKDKKLKKMKKKGHIIPGF